MKRLLGVIALLIVLLGAGAWVDREGLQDRWAPKDPSKEPAPLRFYTPENMAKLGRDAALVGIYAIGSAVVIIAGGIDLSVGAVIAWAGVFAIHFMSSHTTGTGPDEKLVPGLSPWIVCPAVVAGAGVIGAIQGWFITRINLQPFIVTLAGMMLARGTAAILTDGRPAVLGDDYPGFKALATYLPGSWIMVPVVVVGVVAVAAFFFLHMTVWGRHLYAIGRNEQAALYSGIRVNRLRLLTYVISAALAGMAGLLLAAFNEGQASYTDATGYELWAIAGAVLGGVSLRGGEGVIPGILLGSLAFPLLRKVMVFLGVPTTWEYTVVGIVLLGAVLLDEAIRRQEARKAAKKRAG